MVATIQTPKADAIGTDPDVFTHISESGSLGAPYWRLAIQCPHCGDLHTHGGGAVEDGPPQLGHRVAHCIYHPAEGYTLIPGPPDMPEPKALKGVAYRRMRAQGEALTEQRDRERQRRWQEVEYPRYLESADRLEATLATVGY